MKGYFIVSYSGLANDETGIGKKISNQVKALKSNGIECEKYIQNSGRERLPKWLGKLLYILPFTNINPKWENIDKLSQADFLYFRRPIAMTLSMRRFLKKCRERNRRLVVFMEIPSYPYDAEYVGIIDRYLLLKDRVNRKMIKKIVDGVFIVNKDNDLAELFGISAYSIINGYDVENTKIRDYSPHGNKMILVCVAMFSFWHGYERLFRGIKAYYDCGGKRELLVEMVGTGAELESYKKLVRELNIEQRVIFHGKLYGEPIEEVYERADIGIGCLGCYKKNLEITSDLKTREYIAKGIPVLSGCDVDVIKASGGFEFFMKIPNDDSNVNIDDVFEYFDYIQNCKVSRNIENELHDYALENYDIKKTMRVVAEEINNAYRDKQSSIR